MPAISPIRGENPASVRARARLRRKYSALARPKSARAGGARVYGRDAALPASDREAGAEPRDAIDDGEQRDERDDVSDRCRGRIRLQGVDRPLYRPGNRERRERRGPEASDADAVARSVGPEVTPGGPSGRGQPRLPAACGRRAA